MPINHQWGLSAYEESEGKLILSYPSFDIDNFPMIAEALVCLLSATVKEKQLDADLHSWLIDIEGCDFFLKAEHYSESIWLEALHVQESRAMAGRLAALFSNGL